MAVGSLAAAVIFWPLGRALNHVPVEYEEIDPATGYPVVRRGPADHSFFFIPMEYWGVIALAFGIITLFRQ